MKTFCIIGSIVYALVVEFTGKFCGWTSKPMPSITTSESLHRLAVKDGGGKYVGIQECEGVDYDLVLFNSPTTGSTLALKTSEITAAKVAKRIEDSDAAFNLHQSI